MTNFIQKFKDIFKKSESKLEVEKLDTEIKEKERLAKLHKQARKSIKMSKKGLTIEDFDKASRQTEKQKNKTLSSNF